MNQRAQALTEQRERIMGQAERKIWVTFRKEGIHKYPAAATDPSLATGDEYDVSFLASPHRHIFHFRVWIDVFHNDRDVEFIQFKRWLEKLYSSNQGVLSLDYKSCEMISDDLYLQIATKYPDRAVWIEVAEDGENGALIKYELSRPSLSIKI
ncbi:hypothetical protein [Haliscomenobacter sp.]|uniref:hypothetical protein n=1 Tax=Haliscomenobacter sp. TaxID=2717303 RepID=UPI003364B763